MNTINLISILVFIIILWMVCVISIFCSKCSKKKCCEKYHSQKQNKNTNFHPRKKESMKIENFTIFGERCSGTNFLEHAIGRNFDTELTWKYCWKHWFGNHVDFSNSDNTLFLCIYRDPVNWMNSLYKRKHHLSDTIKTTDDFLTKPILSTHGDDKSLEIPNTRNIYTGNIYKNIFELRTVKLHFLLKEMPKKAKYVEIISYEDFCKDYNKIMEKLRKKYNLKIKTNHFPKPVPEIYRGGSTVDASIYKQDIPASKIIPKLDKHIEKLAGYNM